MSGPRLGDVLALAGARSVSDDGDVTGALLGLLTGALEVVPADAAALLVRTPAGDLELLAATSHRAADLEMYQVQAGEGPCLQALHTREPVDAVGSASLLGRWPVAGPAILAAGYTAVHAAPLHWRGETFGALNLFRVAGPVLSPAEAAACQALADATTMLVVSGHLDTAHLTLGLERALAARAVVERAKGALAHLRGLDMDRAYEALAGLAAEEGVGLGEAARQVLDRARRQSLD